MDNKNMQIYDKDQSSYSARRRLAVISIICCLVLIFVVIFAVTTFIHPKSRPQQADQNHSTTFDGMSSFIDSGLSTTQVNDLVKAFSKFAPSAKAVVVDRNSLVPGPHDPNSANATFTINFSVNIDNAPYKATVSYLDLNNIRLYVYNPRSNALIYDSGVVAGS